MENQEKWWIWCEAARSADQIRVSGAGISAQALRLHLPPLHPARLGGPTFGDVLHEIDALADQVKLNVKKLRESFISAGAD